MASVLALSVVSDLANKLAKMVPKFLKKEAILRGSQVYVKMKVQKTNAVTMFIKVRLYFRPQKCQYGDAELGDQRYRVDMGQRVKIFDDTFPWRWFSLL
jgi:hypothetical protein